MNRLQKKCFIVSAGLHLLLGLILLVGPAFLASKSKVDDMQVLDFIPSNLIDKPFSNPGAGNAAPPLATQSQPEAAPRQPAPQPPPKTVETEPPKTKPDAESLEPAKDSKPQRQFKFVNKSATRTDTSKKTSEAESRAKELAAQKLRAELIGRTLRNLRGTLSSSTSIDMPVGGGSVGEAYASYAQAVKSIYTAAWVPPDDTASDDANVKVTVTIASDGTVLSAHILNPSGDAQVDKSVQRALDSVRFIAPFPNGAKEKERTYKINFNLKAKRMIG